MEKNLAFIAKLQIAQVAISILVMAYWPAVHALLQMGCSETPGY